MQTDFHSLAFLGWTPDFLPDPPLEPGEALARVAAVDRDRLLLLDGDGAFHGRMAGRWWHADGRGDDPPCAGDWVAFERPGADGEARVTRRLPRRAALRRRAAGSAGRAQTIAANVDTVFVVTSCGFDFNVKRLERYLVMVAEGGAAAVVLLTKTDLAAPEELEALRERLRAAGLRAPLRTLSRVSGEGLSELADSLEAGRTYGFVGSSGVGKSTLVNFLAGEVRLRTAGLSGTGEGRHTTVRRELLLLPGGALVIDGPGMREFGVLDAEAGLGGGFGDVEELAAGCRYRDCTHAGEPGCAVLAALAAGELDREHHANYLKLREEAEHYGRTAAERRRRERSFGKRVKAFKKRPR